MHTNPVRQPPAPDPDRETGRWLMAAHRLAGVPGLASLILPLINGGLLVLQALTLAQILDRAIVGGEALTGLVPLLGALAGLFALRAALVATADSLAAMASERLKHRLRVQLGHTIFERGPLWTSSKASGALSSVIVEQVEALDGFFSRYMPALVQATILPLAFAIVVMPFDWVVGALFLLTAPLIPVFMALAGWGAEAASKAQAAALSRLTARFADRLRGLVTLKLFGRAASETAAVYQASENLRRRSMRVMRIAFLSSAVLEFFAALGVAGVALYIGLSYLGLIDLRGGAELSLAAGLFCLLMAPDVYASLRLLAAHYHDRAAAKAALNEITEQIGCAPELPRAITLPKAAATPLPRQHRAASVSISGLDIETPTGVPVISGAELTVAAGAHVAIVGVSGIGKSTLLEAMARLRPFSGSITLDGKSLGAFEEHDLRGRVAFMGQRSRIVAGTIAENIRLGRVDACDTAVSLAAQRAMVSDFADTLPDGLATRIGENGVGLSGGELQRIALARLYLRNPDIVLLDEPTAHLDADTEARVLNGIIGFAHGRTLIIATHSAAVAGRMRQVYRIAGLRLLPALRPLVPSISLERGAA
jgi:ATP-binding cassette subfamily C protein CydD